jgi:hydrogenase-4 transcriptional activator
LKKFSYWFYSSLELWKVCLGADMNKFFTIKKTEDTKQAHQIEENGWNDLPRFDESVRSAIESFQYEEAIHLGEQVLALELDLNTEAPFRCLMSEAYESLACFTKAAEVLGCYDEESVAFGNLPAALQALVALRLAHAGSANSNLPKAISHARLAWQLARQNNEKNIEQQAQILMSVVYRRLGELELAKNELVEILKQGSGVAPEAKAQALNNLGIIQTVGGQWETARQTLLKGIDTICDHEAPLLRGSLDVNLAAILTLQGKMREATVLLERALPQLERARNPRLLVNARSNLGYNLVRLGQMERAQTMLEKSRIEAEACEAHLVLASTLENLAELHSIQGRDELAESLFDTCLASLQSLRVSFNQALVKITYGKHWLQKQAYTRALESFRHSLEISELTGDPRGQIEARLYLIKTLLRSGNLSEAETTFAGCGAEVTRLDSLPIRGQYYEVLAILAVAKSEPEEAIRRYKQAISIWEVLDNPFQFASNHYLLGLVLRDSGDHVSAKYYLEKSLKTFEALSAAPRVKLANEALQNIESRSLGVQLQVNQIDRLVHSLSALYEADSSSLLTIPEFTRLLHEEFGARPIILFREEHDQVLKVIAVRGCDEDCAIKIGNRLRQQKLEPDEFVREFQNASGEVYWLYLKRTDASLTDSVLELFLWHLRRILTKAGNLSEPGTAKSTAQSDELKMPGIVYNSPAMRQIAEQIHRLQKANINVLISGESGTGKELIARAIHQLSSRAKQPIVPFNCAAAPRELVESQLFGHRRGAFTGAHAAYGGVIGAASKGTLFLDEIGEMALDVQPKLLRFLQSGEIQRLGEATPIVVDVRLIAATNCELEQLIQKGQFRADLFYRLNVIRFHLPPLRERREEISLLTNHFISTYSSRENKSDIQLSAGALNCLEAYSWPGNARELGSEIHRAVALADSGDSILPEHFSNSIHHSIKSGVSVTATNKIVTTAKKMTDVLSEIQQELVSQALESNDWNISKTARELGVSRLGLRTMIRRFNLELPTL